MKKRCYSPGDISYPYYGGRGVRVCDEWRDDYQRFLADLGECPAGLTLDRKDGHKNYQPDNCRWVSKAEQNRNKSTAKLTADDARHIRARLAMGTKTEAELAIEYGVQKECIRRIRTGQTWAEGSGATVSAA